MPKKPTTNTPANTTPTTATTATSGWTEWLRLAGAAVMVAILLVILTGEGSLTENAQALWGKIAATITPTWITAQGFLGRAGLTGPLDPLGLVAAHLVGDYVLQTHTMAAQKLSRAGVRTLHVLSYLAPFAVVALMSDMNFETAALFLLSVGIPHWIVDSRRWASGTNWAPRPIFVDQAIHAACLWLTLRAFS